MHCWIISLCFSCFPTYYNSHLLPFTLLPAILLLSPIPLASHPVFLPVLSHMHQSIVIKVEWLWTCWISLFKMLCQLFLTWGCTMFKSIPIILIFSTSKNLALIYTRHICEQKRKNCAPSGNFQHKMQHHSQSSLLWSMSPLIKQLLH